MAKNEAFCLPSSIRFRVDELTCKNAAGSMDCFRRYATKRTKLALRVLSKEASEPASEGTPSVSSVFFESSTAIKKPSFLLYFTRSEAKRGSFPLRGVFFSDDLF